MALTTPIITNLIQPFPATQSYDVTFNVVGGDQVVSNELEIQKTLDNLQVYLLKIDSFQFKHTIPQNTLVNGIEYKARLRTYNVSGQYSNWSNWVVFYCHSNPQITIPTIVDGKVNNQTVLFTGTYTQAENDLLQSYRFLLYNNLSNLIQSYEEKFDGLLQQEITSLENNENYYIELKTISVHGMEGTSGKIPFLAQYIAPQLTSAITLENLSDEASIKVTATIIQIIGQIGSGLISYENNELVNLKNGMIYFQDGFSLSGNFTLKLWLKNITENTIFLKLVSGLGILELKFEENRIHLYKYANNDVFKYHIWTNETISPLSTDIVYIGLQQIDNYCNIYTQIVV